MKPLLEGTFTTPSGETIDVRWHIDGLEEYFVDGERVLSSKAQKTSFTRYFSAGSHQVQIKFSLMRLYCRAYVDGELVAPQVFENFSKFHNRLDSSWPTTSSWMGGVKAAKQGFWAALLISILSIALSLYSIRVAPILDGASAGLIFIQGIVFIPIMIGIRKHSRIAAVVGLGWYGLLQLGEIMATGGMPNLLVLMLVLMLVNGVRGVFAIHRFPGPVIIDPADRVRRYLE